ncbi:MAG TPA: DUF433 domain-containing protein [Phycisphaerae bacterium]|jgi:uncharacterized protein (DUF433 family)|nr:DUF433 domain-containing protein [Phycisphaerae bacterium]
MRWQDYIHQTPTILLGKPVFVGTRISVEMILEELGAGDSIEDICRNYPHLTPDHVRAACAYAAASLKRDETVFLEANISL